MTNEEKIKVCIIASAELRQVNCIFANQQPIVKVQQKHYNYDGTAFVWRDIEIQYFDYSKFSQKISFD